MYAINLWGSHPDDENDDCWTGVDVETREQAEAIFHAADPVEAIAKLPGVHANFYSYHYGDTTHVELDGPDVNKVRQVRKARKRADSGEWQRERAMQAGMAFGCDGYNDEMGWG